MTNNKLLISILAFLVVFSGGIGYHAYTVNQQISQLNEQLATFQTEQAVQSSALSNELSILKEETRSLISGLKSELEGKVTENSAKINSLESKIDQNRNEINSLQGRLDETQAKMNTLEGEVKGTTELSRVVMDVNAIYQRISQATVRISNGKRTIGSGFVFDDEAHVVTAQHVVENLSEIYVVLANGSIFKATLKGSSPQSDVAVLTLDSEPMVEPPKLADSAEVKIGEPVAIIGSPFALAETITTGVVSQTNRFADIEYDKQTRWVANLIQFDAAANFGNSGGPLVNAKSEIIGMVIARISPEEGDGIYYAVSANKLKRVADAIIAQGTFPYPWIGISIVDLTPQMVEARALKTMNGVLVENIFADGPAGKAGVKIDDIIVAMDGTAMRNIADLVSYLGEHKSPGDKTMLTVIRDTTKVDLSLEVGQRP